ncbi:HAD family hydrolase [Pseudogemmobacter faecipullorum]|uniref:phosphoglycolate phosphatase n=1 Tax=Pseudogemmobacter faecipullorum TaxID=2755041 RepID=A0ABS8CKF8_9RHOB|nr:HAD family hydrolase [Pseudogemmobacter faecipullorum]MCB5409859.1 HAD family hydrolase [Pseudogemmobacter faecipullorum]
MIDAILFDKDGTLFDFHKSWGAWARQLLADLTVDEAHAARLAAAIGYLPEEGRFLPGSLVIAGTPSEITAAMLPELPGWSAGQLEARINEVAAKARMVEAVPLVPLFEAFRARGLKLAIVTNDAEAPARAHVAAHNLGGLVDFVAGYDSGHGAKPGPGMLNAFLRAEGLDPARVLMVGDSLHDLEAGRAAGTRRVAVLTGVAKAASLAPHADVVLENIGEIPAWIDSLSA